jgi:tetratricopeptide (TPR) repeat protein
MSMPDSNPRFLVISELQRAEVFACAGDWMSADQCYATAVAVDNSPQSRLTFANSLAERESYNAAICQLTAALDMASETGDREALGVIFHNLASIYRELGDADLARRFQQRAVLQMDDCGPDELLGLANDAWLSRRTELATSLAAGCTMLEEDSEAALEAHATAAIFGGLAEDPRSGIRNLIHVYRQHQLAGSNRLMGIDLLNLSALLCETGRHQAELGMVRRAVQHFEQAPAPLLVNKARQVLEMLERMQSLRDFDPSVN